MELMLLGLGFCLGYDMVMILRRMRKEVTGYRIQLTGKRAEEPPSVYTEVTLEHVITGEKIPKEAVERALELAEHKYCSASAMFAKTATLINTYRIEEASQGRV
jgi:putative redox protein